MKGHACNLKNASPAVQKRLSLFMSYYITSRDPSRIPHLVQSVTVVNFAWSSGLSASLHITKLMQTNSTPKNLTRVCSDSFYSFEIL